MSSSEKQSVALVSDGWPAPLLAAAKLVAAVFTGSLGILSEAIHSVIDFGATIITYFAIRWGDQPADDEHHYGHAKIESIAALVETALLFLTTAWVVLGGDPAADSARRPTRSRSPGGRWPSSRARSSSTTTAPGR